MIRFYLSLFAIVVVGFFIGILPIANLDMVMQLQLDYISSYFLFVMVGNMVVGIVSFHIGRLEQIEFDKRSNRL